MFKLRRNTYELYPRLPSSMRERRTVDNARDKETNTIYGMAKHRIRYTKKRTGSPKTKKPHFAVCDNALSTLFDLD